MTRPWQYVLHQHAFEFVDQLAPRDRRQGRAAPQALVAAPYSEADGEIRPLDDRPYQVRKVGKFQIVYWLDVWVREVDVVRVERCAH